MKVAIVSDLHLDFYTSSYANERKTETLLDTYILKGEIPDVLIIAGDISHYNVQTFHLCKILNSRGIKVLLTSGNHEFYNISKRQQHRYVNLYDKVKELNQMLEGLEDTYFLDGDCVDISDNMTTNDNIDIDGYDKIKHLEKEFVLEKIKDKKFETTKEMVEFILK